MSRERHLGKIAIRPFLPDQHWQIDLIILSHYKLIDFVIRLSNSKILVDQLRRKNWQKIFNVEFHHLPKIPEIREFHKTHR